VLSRIFTSPLKNPLPRKVLVIVQYSISIFLLIIAIVNVRQLIYLRSADLGFNRDDVIILPVCNTPIVDEYFSFKEDLLKHSEIKSMTIMSDIIGVNHNTRQFEPVGFKRTNKQSYPMLVVGADFVKTFEIKVIAGIDFTELSENKRIDCILINQEMAKYLGCDSIQEAIGKILISFGTNYKIIGVINDFNVNSLHKHVGPVVLSLAENRRQTAWLTNYLAIRVNPEKYLDALRIIKKEWKKYALMRPFEFSSLDRKLNEQYKNEDLLVKLTVLFTLIAIFIASLGILGLTSFLSQQRTKEIGIRKVLGASIYQIIEMLSLEFIKLILIANFVAWPFAYLLVKVWLGSFAYQIGVQLWMFVLAAFIAIVFALTMLILETAKAANINPVQALRYE